MNWRDEGIELDTEMKQVLAELASFLDCWGRHDDAVTLLTGLQHLVVYKEVPLGQLAGTLAGRGRLPEALSTIDRALSYNPESTQNHIKRAEILFRMGEVEGAWTAALSARRLGRMTDQDAAYLDTLNTEIASRRREIEGVRS